MKTWVSRLLLVAVSLAGLQVVGGTSANSYITQKDYDVQAKASKKAADACGSYPHGKVDREKGRKSLENGAGGDNPILQILTKAENQDDLGDKAGEEIKPAEVGQKLLPLVMCFVLIFVWLICCWTAFPFCKCCRCGAKQRQTSFLVKLLGLIVLGALIVGIVVCASLGISGFQAGRDGMKDMECTSSRMLNVTLAGEDAPPFIGLLPLLNIFASLEQSLEDGSQFVDDVNNMLANTNEIDSALTFANGNLQLLRDVMNEPANKRPTDGLNVDLLHDCKLCTELVPVLDNTITALDAGVGGALQAARTEVQAQISSSKRADLRSALSDSSTPVVEVKGSMRDSMEWFIDADSFGQVNEAMSGDTPYVLMGVLLISFMAALLMVCACMGMILFLVKEKGGDGAGQNPYCRCVHRCAGCTWCCAFFYAILAFLIGGLLIIVTFFLSSMCLIMDDLDGPMIRDIAPALGMSSTDDDAFFMMVDIVDKCLTVKDPNAAGNLLDILHVTENGQKKTISTKIEDETKTKIDDVFQSIDNRSGLTMNGNPSVVKLKNILRNQDVDSMMLPDSTSMRADARFSAMDTPSSLSNAFVTSTKCADGNITEGLPNAGDTIKGIDSFMTQLLTFGTGGVSVGCAQNVVCTSSNAECTAGNNFIDLKQELLSSNRYRCDLFEDPGNPLAVCDPKNMVGSGGGPYTGDCMFSSGTALRRKQVSCNLAQFVTYCNDWSARLDKAFGRVDGAATATFSGISVTLRGIVDRYLVAPIAQVALGANCGFIAQTYRGVVDSLCYQGAYGLRAIGNSYAVLAILSVILILVMYMLWRRSIDNVNSWEKAEK